MIHISQIGPDHFTPALDLLLRFLRSTPEAQRSGAAEEGFITPPDQIRSGLQFLLRDEGSAAFLAKEGETAVGVATVSMGLSIEYGRYAEIDDLYVLPTQRGQGIAKQLINAALDWCRSRGCQSVLVTITPEGESAHGLTRFYSKLGFVDTQRKLMSLTLTR